MTEADCPLCEYIKKNKDKALFSDGKVIAFLADKPSTLGHIRLMPLEHYPILELVPDYVVRHLFTVANKLSTAIFGALNAQGTNVLVNNGVAAGQDIAHVMVHILPRRDNDSLDFTWQPKQLDEQEMSTAELSLKDEANFIGSFEEEKQAPIKLDAEQEETVKKESEPAEEPGKNYQTEQLDRIP